MMNSRSQPKANAYKNLCSLTSEFVSIRAGAKLCRDKASYRVPAAAVNGICGAANGVGTTSKRTTNLADAASAVMGKEPYAWSWRAKIVAEPLRVLRQSGASANPCSASRVNGSGRCPGQVRATAAEQKSISCRPVLVRRLLLLAVA